MKLSTCAFIAALQFFGVASAATIDAEIARLEKLNEQCRGGSGDSPLTQKACDERDKLISGLGKKGWCYGHEGQASYERQWERCSVGETVSLYLPHDGKDGRTYQLDTVSLVAYPKRPCPYPELAGYQRMHLAVMSRVNLCYFISNNQTVVLSPFSAPSEYPNVFFATASLSPNQQAATITHPNFDSKTAQEKLIENQRSITSRAISPLETR